MTISPRRKPGAFPFQGTAQSRYALPQFIAAVFKYRGLIP